jgi:O-antigen/teichoic acid export membrane protein
LPIRDADVTRPEGEDQTPNESMRPLVGASIRRNALFALLAQITTGLFTTVLTLYLLRALGPDGYGVFALALGIGAVVGLIADFGIPYSVSRFLAESRHDHERVVSLLSDALRLKLASAALLTGVLFALAGPLAAAYDNPALTWPIRGIALSLFASSIFSLYTSAFIALAHVSVNLRLTFLESLVETVASILLVALGAGAVGAALGRTIGYAFGALAAMVIVGRLFTSSSIRPFGRGSGRTREIAVYAAPLFITEGVYTIYAQVDVLIIGALLGTTAVGLFSAPFRLTVPLGYVGQSLANSVAPRLAHRGREAGSVKAFQSSLRGLIVYQSILLAPLIVWAGPIVNLLLGSQYRASADVLRVLSLYIFFDGPSRLISTTVNYLGRAASRIPIVLFSLGFNVALDLILIPSIGVVGAAVGTSLAISLLYVPAHLRVCRQELDLELVPIAATLTRALVSAALMASVLYAVGTESLSAAQWILGGAAGVVVFCAGLVLTGEITRSDIRKGRRAMMANLSQLAPFGLR